MATPEGRWKDKIKKILKTFNVWYFLPVSRGMGVHGIPDFVCCVPIRITADMVGMDVGLFLAIESKAEGKDATKLQDLQIKKITKSNGLAFPLRPSEKSQLEELLRRLTGND